MLLVERLTRVTPLVDPVLFIESGVARSSSSSKVGAGGLRVGGGGSGSSRSTASLERKESSTLDSEDAMALCPACSRFATSRPRRALRDTTQAFVGTCLAEIYNIALTCDCGDAQLSLRSLLPGDRIGDGFARVATSGFSSTR